jgi:hypothetical protein
MNVSAATESAGFPPGLKVRKVFGIAPNGGSVPDEDFDTDPIQEENEARASLCEGERLFSKWLTDWVPMDDVSVPARD